MLGMSQMAMSTNTLGMSWNAMSTNSLGLSADSSTDVRAAIADHLLLVRYRIGPDADGWYLGGGRDKADSFLGSLESKDETREIVLDLRKIFDVPSRPYRPLSVFHERDVSFDLDQYIADIGPQGDEDDTFSLHVPSHQKNQLKYRSSMSSIITNYSSTTVASSHHEDFTICEATRVPMTSKSVEYRFPEHSDLESVESGSSNTHSVGIIPRFAQSMTNLVNPPASSPPRLRRATQQLTSPLLPSSVPATAKLPNKQFPSMTPPESPALPLTKEMPSTIQPQSSFSSVDSGMSRRQNENDRRRHKFRQHVIVDGEHVSPERKGRRLAHEKGVEAGVEDKAEAKETSILSSILPLFSNPSVTESQVYEKLSEVVELEAKRVAARGEPFDAHAKSRVIWILEEVAKEVSKVQASFDNLTDKQLSRPELVAAVERVVKTLKERPSYTTPPRQLAPLTPSPARPKLLHGKRDLTIIVPPRMGNRLVLASPDRSSRNTFGTLETADPPTPRQTPPPAVPSRTAVSEPVTPALDGDRTPIRSTFAPPMSSRAQDMPTIRYSKSHSRRTSVQTAQPSPPTPNHAAPRHPSSSGLPKKVPATSSPPRTAIQRKPVPPLPALPSIPPAPINVHAL